MSNEQDSATGDVVRYHLDERVRAILLLLAIVLLISGWVTYAAYTDPGVETEERTLGTYEPAVEYDHEGTAVEGNPIYPPGTVVENQSGYYFNVTPVVDGEYVYEYETSEQTDVELDTELELVLRGYDEPDDDEDPEIEYWRLDESLAEETDQYEGTDGEQTVPFELDIRQLENRLWQIDEDVRTPPDRPEDDFGTLPGVTEIAVVANTTVTTEIAGEPVERSEENRFTLTPVAGMAQVGTETESEPITVEETTASPASPGTLGGIVAPLLFGAALIAAAVLIAGRAEGTLAPPADRIRRYEMRRARDRFDDWISVGTLPDRYRDQEPIRVSSLEDLVDTAIDTNGRVIEDELTNRYYVIDDATCYEYVAAAERQDDE